MLRKITVIFAGLLLLTVVLMTLVGCAGPKQEEIPSESGQLQESEASAPTELESEGLPSESEPSATPEQEPEEVPSEPVPPSETEPPEVVEEVKLLRISEPEGIQKELYDAICAVRQPAPMDVSGITLGENPEMAVKNLYYKLMSRYSELKYAYDISAAAESGCLICQVSYMPYKTGSWPESKNALTVSTLGELLHAAEDHIGAEPLPIHLTDPSLAPDDINHVLQQAGGYILCALNRDGTAVTYTPAMGMDMEECLSLLEQADQLAEQVVAQEVSDSMTEREKAEALYTYLISHVKYDQRYYSDRKNMPYDSRTAIGALRDNLAICGGYSHALKLLFEKAGITCFNVIGKYFNANHMWSIARLDGEWLWFDATSDRGLLPQFGFRHFALKELDTTQYQWKQEQVDSFLQTESAK